MYSSALLRIALYCTAPFCTVSGHTAPEVQNKPIFPLYVSSLNTYCSPPALPHCTVLHCTALHCTGPHITLHYTALPALIYERRKKLYILTSAYISIIWRIVCCRITCSGIINHNRDRLALEKSQGTLSSWSNRPDLQICRSRDHWQLVTDDQWLITDHELTIIVTCTRCWSNRMKLHHNDVMTYKLCLLKQLFWI
jgi:hypothetical protein